MVPRNYAVLSFTTKIITLYLFQALIVSLVTSRVTWYYLFKGLEPGGLRMGRSLHNENPGDRGSTRLLHNGHRKKAGGGREIKRPTRGRTQALEKNSCAFIFAGRHFLTTFLTLGNFLYFYFAGRRGGTR